MASAMLRRPLQRRPSARTMSEARCAWNRTGLLTTSQRRNRYMADANTTPRPLRVCHTCEWYEIQSGEDHVPALDYVSTDGWANTEGLCTRYPPRYCYRGDERQDHPEHPAVEWHLWFHPRVAGWERCGEWRLREGLVLEAPAGAEMPPADSSGELRIVFGFPLDSRGRSGEDFNLGAVAHAYANQRLKGDKIGFSPGTWAADGGWMPTDHGWRRVCSTGTPAYGVSPARLDRKRCRVCEAKLRKLGYAESPQP